MHIAHGQWQNAPLPGEEVWQNPEMAAAAEAVAAAEALETADAADPAVADGVKPAVADDAEAVQHDNDGDQQHGGAALGALPHPALATFISQWCALVDHLISEASDAELTNDVRSSLADVVDGRLWHFMFRCVSMTKPTGLSSATLQTAKHMMHDICQAAGIAEADMLRVVAILQPVVTASNMADADADQPLLHDVQGNALVDQFIGSAQHDDQQGEVQAPAAQEMRVFSDT